MKRPLGVILLAAYMLLNALLAALQLVFFNIFSPLLDPAYVNFILAVDLISMVIFPLLAVGLWKMKMWSRQGVIAISLLAVIMAVPRLNIFSFIINVLILWYLFQPNIKSVFE